MRRLLLDASLQLACCLPAHPRQADRSSARFVRPTVQNLVDIWLWRWFYDSADEVKLTHQQGGSIHLGGPFPFRWLFNTPSPISILFFSVGLSFVC